MTRLNKLLLVHGPVIMALAIVLVSAPVTARADDYRAIDEHALKAPKELENSIDSLVDYLIKPARNDKEKLRAIFRWISTNISYDTEGFWAAHADQKTTTEPIEKKSTKPAVTEPTKTEPVVTKPAVTEPTKTEPAVTQPAVTEPAKIEPAKTEPAVTQPPVTEQAVKMTPEEVIKRHTANCDGYTILMEAMTQKALTIMQEMTKKASSDMETMSKSILQGITKQVAGTEDTMAKQVASTTDTMAKQAAGTVDTITKQAVATTVTRQARLLDVVGVKGFAKGYGYRVGSDFEGKNHAWNAVNLDGKWYFLDCTWGAGLPNAKGEFVYDFEDYYFLTSPEELVYTHFPESPESQHIEKPVSKQEFIELPYLWPAFFKYGMKIGNQTKSIIKAGNNLDINLYAPDSVLVQADLLSGGRFLGEEYAFVERDSAQLQIKTVFPKAGEYVLQIFTRTKGSTGVYKETLDYKIFADSGSTGPVGFPTTYEPFHLHNAYIYEPLTRVLEPGKKYHFRLKVPGGAETSVVIGDSWNHLTKNGDIFEGEVEIPAGQVSVYSRFTGSMQSELSGQIIPSASSLCPQMLRGPG